MAKHIWLNPKFEGFSPLGPYLNVGIPTETIERGYKKRAGYIGIEGINEKKVLEVAKILNEAYDQLEKVSNDDGYIETLEEEVAGDFASFVIGLAYQVEGMTIEKEF